MLDHDLAQIGKAALGASEETVRRVIERGNSQRIYERLDERDPLQLEDVVRARRALLASPGR